MVRLRALEPEDLELLYRIENDATLWRYGSTTAPFSRYQLRSYIESASGNAFADGQVRLAVENSDGQTVGFVDLLDINALHARAEVGVVILNDYQRQGCASEALCLLKEYARGTLQLHQLYAYIPADNLPSTKLFTRVGFVHTATLADWLSTPDGWMDASIYSLVLS